MNSNMYRHSNTCIRFQLLQSQAPAYRVLHNSRRMSYTHITQKSYAILKEQGYLMLLDTPNPL